MKIPKIFIPEKNFENSIERLLKEEIKHQQRYTKFEVIQANTYAEGIAQLKEQGKKPFAFAENVEARILDYETNGEDTELFETWLDSITGIAYKAKSTKFKLILRSNKLENVKSNFNQDFIPIDYDTEQGVEFDSAKGKYYQPLTRKEAKNHEFWLAAMNGDKEKLAEYVDLWFNKTGKERGMGVYLRGDTGQDELRGLTLNDDDYGSLAVGYDNLSLSARFVSGAK